MTDGTLNYMVNNSCKILPLNDWLNDFIFKNMPLKMIQKLCTLKVWGLYICFHVFESICIYTVTYS